MGRSIAIAVIAAALSVAAPLFAHAAGLGKLTVLSPLGQPLNAEIEIVSLQPGEEEGLVARLASSEAFRQAGMEFNPALLGVRLTIERRDGRALLRARTTQPVSEPFLDMLVELQWNSGRLMREYTFLLDPPEYKEKAQAAIAAAPSAEAPAKPAPQAAPAAPAPKVEAKPIAPSPSPSPSAPASSAQAKAAAQHEVKKGETLASIARQHVTSGVSLNQMLVAIYRANQDAFIRDNLNLVRAGRILNIPDTETASGVAAEDANRLVQSQMADFAQYRSRLASAPASADGSAGQRDVTGRIEAKPEAAPPAAQDQLRLSKADSQKAGPGSRAARGDDRVAQERAAKEAESRVADLEKNVADLQKLLELKNQQLAELEKKSAKPAAAAPAAPAAAPAPVAKAPEAPKPAAEAPTPAAEASKPAAEAQKPAAEAPKPAAEAPKPGTEAPTPAAESAKPADEAPKPPVDAAKKDAPKPAPAKPAVKKSPPPPEPSLIDEFLENPLYLGLLGAVVLLLVGYGTYAWRRKKASQTKFTDSVLGASGSAAVSGSPSVFSTPSAASVAAPSGSQTSVSQPAGMAAEEVDPIAEADVYMAYGRDAQAEEILKEALQKDPSRIPVLAKLCEIYANRRDTKAFEQIALKLKGLTNSAGPEWEKAASLGRSIDPQNGLYASSRTGGAAAAALAAAPAAPALDFDLGGSTAQTTAPDITLDDAPKEASGTTIDFDVGAATTPSTAVPAPAGKKDDSDFTPEGTLIMGANEPEHTVSGLDFDLGLGADEKKDSPAPASPAAPAADLSGGLDFDLNLDLGMPGDKPAEDKSAPAAMDLSSISLDLGSVGEPSASDTSGDPKWQEVATKLDLAKAYEEMGDKDGARELLSEVVKDGDAAQQAQAQQLLAKLG